MAHHDRAYGQGHGRLHRWGRSTEVIAEKTQILNIRPINLSRRKQPVGQTKLSGVGFSWRAKPGAIRPRLVAKGHLLRQTPQVFLHLALDPARSIFAQDKKVWGMPGRDVARIVLVAILQFDLACGLVVKLQDVWIVVYQVSKGEFIAVALKLDRASHFDGGIGSAHVASRTLHVSSRR